MSVWNYDLTKSKKTEACNLHNKIMDVWKYTQYSYEVRNFFSWYIRIRHNF